jgi:curli biogenesis system outer membrane secretion channel CsgG
MSIFRYYSGIAALFLLLGPAVILSCSHAPYDKNAIRTVAVWDLDDLSPEGYARPDLGELLSSRIIEVIQKTGRYSVIERERLHLILEELNLGTTSLVDERTRLKLGKISGAQFMVFGGYQVIGNTMRIDLRLVEVETGRVRKAVQKTASSGDISGWLDSAQKAAEELV